MTKKEAKEKIEKLIERYQRLKPAQIKNYNEMTTRKDFIIPLFEALGWDVYNHDQNEVIEEQSTVEGAVDYSFRINNIPQFLLEAKALKVDLEKVEWAQQSVNYAWNMGVDWVVLTDFEGLKLFNAEEDTTTPRPIKEFTHKEYLTKFEDLWVLSKESFLSGNLDKEAQNWGIKAKRLEVTEKLAKDLMEWRDELFNNFIKWNEEKKEEEIDEAVQRILDRLIFIRSCEDRKIEEKKIWPAFQKWEIDKPDYNFIKTLGPIFKHYNDIYNSNLFIPHFCEELDTDGAPFHKVIKELYGDEKSGIRYNFAAIKPDVLGAVYEQYLGHILKKSKKKNDTDKDRAKRKEQGIYYTPTFIVDYIVENTLGKIVKEKSLIEIENLKVLDPACGSGSFLIRAFDVLDKTLKEKRNARTSQENAYRKYRILTQNINGVDLDEQAIEITRLNLLLRAIEPNCKLPYLSDNTKVGNSLISGTEQELKKYFGSDWKNKKAFNWEEQFPEVFKDDNPGFDVIVGNPPYIMVESLPVDERKYLMATYQTAIKRFDIYIAFIEKGLNLLKRGGFLSFIIPYPFLNQNYAELLRKKILSEFELIEILDLSDVKIFSDAVVRNCVITIRKPLDGNKLKEIVVKKVFNERELSQIDSLPKNKFSVDLFLKMPKHMYRIDLNSDKTNIIKNIENKSLNLGQICYINWGVRSGNVKKYVVKECTDNDCKKMINARNIDRYQINYTNDYLIYKKDELYNPMFEELFESPKIIIRDISGKSRIKSTIDKDKYYAEHTASLAVPWFSLEKVNRKGLIVSSEQKKLSRKYDLKYILANINSTLVNWFFTSKLGGGLHVYPDDVKQFPIYKINFSDKKEKAKHDELVKLADKILKLNKELQKTTKNSDKWEKIKSEIEKTDKIIDEKVYKLYGLTKEEIKIVEDFSN